MRHSGQGVTLEVTIELLPSMLESERSIQVALNEAGCLATGSALERFDTDGSPLVMGTSRWTSKGLSSPRVQQDLKINHGRATLALVFAGCCSGCGECGAGQRRAVALRNAEVRCPHSNDQFRDG